MKNKLGNLNPSVRSTLSVLILSILLTMPCFAQSTPFDTPKPKDIARERKAFPKMKLFRKMRGEEAVAALGTTLPEIAKFYNKSENQLREHLRKDKCLWADKDGRLLYMDQMTMPDAAPVAAGSSITTATTTYPLDQTFLLHSRPGSKKVIYLDFNGHTLHATGPDASIWTTYNANADIIAPPWSIDTDPTTFNDSERLLIQKIWQRVAEDFSPFDIDVTTQEPTADKLTRTSLSDEFFGNRVLISPIKTYFGSYAGLSYIGVFPDTYEYYKIALTFPESLGTNDKYFAEVISHEMGHALGLVHKGTTSGATYYSGHGNWAPIMGVGYYREISQWSKGEYALANNTDDEVTTMQYYGITYYPDDHGNTMATATNLTPSGTNISATGAIEQNTDIDAFAFTTATGPVTLTFTPAPNGPNLNMRADLYNSSGSLILTADPAGLSTSISTSLSAGKYYVLLRSVGEGDPLSTGYSNYASLGQYFFDGVIVPTSSLAPVARITATPSTGSAPLSVLFSSSGSTDPDGTITSYAWNFGDGSSSTLASPSKTFTKSGTFNTSLTVTDNSGMTNSTSLSIVISNTAPVAVISATPASGTAPLTIAFSAASSTDNDGSIASYAWNFGDGTTGTGVSVSHVYNTAGSFTAQLTVTDNLGATHSNTKLITANPPAPQSPVAAFSMSPSTGLAPLSVNFTNSSSDPDGSITSYSWNFGDGTTSTLANPTKVYSKSGSFTISLTVTDNAGLTNSTTKSLTITNTAPVSSFTATPLSGTSPLTVALNAASSTDNDGSIASYAWNFGDGSTGTGAAVSHVYTSAGTFTVQLTVTDNFGATHSSSKIITANPAAPKPPVAAISASQVSGPAPLTVNFNSSGSSDVDGTITTYAWSFGDGTTSTLQNPSKVYLKSGIFTVNLTVTDNTGLTNSASQVITVTNTAPVAVINATPSSGTAPLTVVFSGTSSTDNDGSIASYAWNFGDGSTGTGTTVSHVYNSAGSFTVTLTVTDNLGATHSSSKVITANPPAPQAPVAAFSMSPSTGSAPLSVVFTNSSSNSDGTIASYAWNFGDGTSSTVENPTKVYSKSGSFTVSLSVTDNSGLTNSTTKSLTVTNTAPVAVISATPTSGSAPLTVAFSAASSTDNDGSIASYAWNFGDGSTGTGTTVSHVYNSAGSFTAQLTVTDNLGATHTTSSVITINPEATTINAPTRLFSFYWRYLLRLNWRDNAINETGYYVERAIKPAPGVVPVFTRVATLAANSRSFSTQIAPNTYLFRVQAFNASTTSAYSNTIEVVITPTSSGNQTVKKN